MARPLIEVHKLSKEYGLQKVLSELSFFIAEGEKIALIGRNGAGKSTLMRILTGDEEADIGAVTVHPWTRLGVINQHEILPNEKSTLAFLEERTGKADWQVKKMASQFALKLEHLEKKPLELSGGYQMRVKLTAMLLMEPNLLLLDEPVNYLDLQTLLLLERFLKRYRGSMVIIAHDRAFLEKTCTSTFEIERAGLTTYKGTVSAYYEWKKGQKEFALKQNKKLSRNIAHQQKFVDRFRFKANMASRAQSKIKYIAKIRREMREVQGELSKARIHINSPAIPKGLALRVENLVIGYEGQAPLADNITFDILRGEHVLIAGENGSGKSTILKTLVEKIKPVSGSIKWWHRSTIGYYDQSTDATLISNETVLQHLERMAPAEASGEKILMMAGNFLFRGDDLDKPTSILSGGERSRLCLAGILLHEYNTLILDEPSNHLDVETSEALANALREYTGTILFVSHAQSFVSTLAHKILEIHDGHVRRFMGDYRDYVHEIESQALEEIEDELTAKSQKSDGAQTQKAPQPERREIHSAVRILQRTQVKRMEAMTKQEKEKSELMLFFFENPTDYVPEKRIRLHEVEEELAELERQWLRDEERIEELRAQL